MYLPDLLNRSGPQASVAFLYLKQILKINLSFIQINYVIYSQYYDSVNFIGGLTVPYFYKKVAESIQPDIVEYINPAHQLSALLKEQLHLPQAR